jgi:hypothetical protein
MLLNTEQRLQNNAYKTTPTEQSLQCTGLHAAALFWAIIQEYNQISRSLSVKQLKTDLYPSLYFYKL